MRRLVVITGLSGSGKTLAADCLEDLGYFCVDNLPVELIQPFCDLIQRGSDHLPYAALVIDAREGRALEQFPEVLRKLRDSHTPIEVVFFECSDDLLKRRFSESRRPHPLAREGQPLAQAIQSERQALGRLRELSDRQIDTTGFTAHELRQFLKGSYAPTARSGVPNVDVVSFGFKYGLPAEADLVFDVRFLPNPYFVDELRHLDGRDPSVQRFLDAEVLTAEFQNRVQDLLDFLIPHYAAEGKSYLTVAIGCTGGKHRSVALAERLGAHLETRELPATVRHRDLGRE